MHTADGLGNGQLSGSRFGGQLPAPAAEAAEIEGAVVIVTVHLAKACDLDAVKAIGVL